MIRRPVAILTLYAVLLQALFGAFGGATTLCFGGGHHHHQPEASSQAQGDSACAGCCEHGADLPVPLPVQPDEHHDECPCTDVEIDLTELIAIPRDHADGVVVDAPTPAPVALVIPASGVTDPAKHGVTRRTTPGGRYGSLSCAPHGS